MWSATARKPSRNSGVMECWSRGSFSIASARQAETIVQTDADQLVKRASICSFLPPFDGGRQDGGEPLFDSLPERGRRRKQEGFENDDI